METITYAGYDNCLRLGNNMVELVVSTGFGPRILHYGLLGGPNAFALCPELSKDVGNGETWKPYGGHRLWTAPEVFPRSYFPDNGPVASAHMEGETLHITSAVEHTTLLQKEMLITLAPEGAGARVAHKLTNHSPWPVSVSAWGLSIVANGGRAVLPQEPYASHDDDLLHARAIVVWKFTEMGDPRWRWGTKYITLRQDDLPAERPQKVGVYSTLGWAAHVTAHQAFIIHCPVSPLGAEAFPDGGSSFETYTDGPFQELETLSPLQTLSPGASMTHTEDWYLAPAAGIEDTDEALDARLLPLVAQARQTLEAF